MIFFIQRLISKWNTQCNNPRVNLTSEKIILAIAFIAVSQCASAQNASIDEISNPTTCGAYNHAGWSVPGERFINGNVLFGSGDPEKDPYEYAGLSRAPDGKIVHSYGTADYVDSGSSGNPTKLEIETQNAAGRPRVSEYQETIYRLEGVPGTAGNVTYGSAGGADNVTAWIENISGTVIANAPGVGTTDDGWVFDSFNSVTLNFTYPANGIVFLNGGIFDPSANFGSIRMTGYECPAPSLSIDKVADNAGPYTVGDVVSYTYTVTNNGDETIQGVTITDTHNGSDPAPVPTNETLIIDTAPTGDSTDSSTDGSWDILAPGDIITFTGTGTYTITQTDVDNL